MAEQRTEEPSETGPRGIRSWSRVRGCGRIGMGAGAAVAVRLSRSGTFPNHVSLTSDRPV